MAKIIALTTFLVLAFFSAMDKNPTLASANIRMALAFVLMGALFIAARKEYEEFMR